MRSSLVGEKNRSFLFSDLTVRVPHLGQSDLLMLATIGTLNSIFTEFGVRLHRRDALWQVQKYSARVLPMLEGVIEQDASSPLKRMEIEERLVADFHDTGMTVGPHPMAYRRQQLREKGIVSARELKQLWHNRPAVVAGAVITRQRPRTAKGLIFLTLEDETGHANIIVMLDVYSGNPLVVLRERFVCACLVQSQDGVVHLRAQKIMPMNVSAADVVSHDFH